MALVVCKTCRNSRLFHVLAAGLVWRDSDGDVGPWGRPSAATAAARHIATAHRYLQTDRRLHATRLTAATSGRLLY